MRKNIFLKTLVIALIVAILGFVFVFFRQQHQQFAFLFMRYFPFVVASYIIIEGFASFVFSKEQNLNYSITRILRMVLGSFMFGLHVLILVRF